MGCNSPEGQGHMRTADQCHLRVKVTWGLRSPEDQGHLRIEVTWGLRSPEGWGHLRVEVTWGSRSPENWGHLRVEVTWGLRSPDGWGHLRVKVTWGLRSPADQGHCIGSMHRITHLISIKTRSVLGDFFFLIKSTTLWEVPDTIASDTKTSYWQDESLL